QLSQATTFEISPGYFAALGVPLLRGREFDDHDQPKSQPVAIINEEMARKYFAKEDAVGKRLRIRYIDQQTPQEPWLTVVGVVGSTRSIRYNQMQWDTYPAVYTAMYQRPDGPRSEIDARTQTVFVYVQSGPGLSGGAIASAVHAIDPELPIGSLRTTAEIVS